MPYTNKNYPTSMKNLKPEIKEKAIDILNALIDEKKMEEGLAIRTAISRAKDWAVNRGIDVPDSPSDKKVHGEDIHVVPREKGWGVKKENADRVSHIYNTKMEAVSKARNQARKKHTSLIIHRKTGDIQKRISYTK